MLWKKLQQAKKNLGLEEKLITSPENEHRIVEKEEVIIGQDYYEDNSDYDNGERPDLGEGILEQMIVLLMILMQTQMLRTKKTLLMKKLRKRLELQ